MGRFWNKQPTAICKQREGPGLIKKINIENVHTERGNLPPGFLWGSIRKIDEEMCGNVKRFLDRHYVSDSENRFRLSYSNDFIRDFLNAGGGDLHASVITEETKELVGFIAAANKKVCIAGKDVSTVEVNLLCVHSSYRQKKLAEFLITEITRMVNLKGIFTAIHTSGKAMPISAFCTSRYYHKFLDIKKLNKVGYTEFSDDDISTAIRHHEHKKQKKSFTNPMETYILRNFSKSDIPIVKDMFELEKTDHTFTEIIDGDALQNMATARYLDNYVVEEINMIKKTRRISGFISIYNMDLLVLKDGVVEDTLATSYINHYCGKTLACMTDVFSLLQGQGKSVVNCLDINENKTLARLFNMLPGTGYLYYYMYNYRMPVLPSEEMAYMVL